MTLNDVDHVRLDNYNQQLNDEKKKTEFRSTELANHLSLCYVQRERKIAKDNEKGGTTDAMMIMNEHETL